MAIRNTLFYGTICYVNKYFLWYPKKMYFWLIYMYNFYCLIIDTIFYFKFDFEYSILKIKIEFTFINQTHFLNFENLKMKINFKKQKQKMKTKNIFKKQMHPKKL